MVEKDEQISHRELLLIRISDNSDTFNCLDFEGIKKKKIGASYYTVGTQWAHLKNHLCLSFLQ